MPYETFLKLKKLPCPVAIDLITLKNWIVKLIVRHYSRNKLKKKLNSRKQTICLFLLEMCRHCPSIFDMKL